MNPSNIYSYCSGLADAMPDEQPQVLLVGLLQYEQNELLKLVRGFNLNLLPSAQRGIYWF